MRKVLLITLVVILGFSALGCGASRPVWNDSENAIYSEFVELQKQVQSKMDELDTNQPSTYDEAKKTAQFVWNWKAYEESSISEVYKNWRTSAGEAIESKALLFFYKTTDPNYKKVLAEKEFAEQAWLFDAGKVLEAVENLKK